MAEADRAESKLILPDESSVEFRTPPIPPPVGFCIIVIELIVSKDSEVD